MPKGIFIVRNRMTLQATILGCSEAGVQGNPIFFSTNTIIQQQVN